MSFTFEEATAMKVLEEAFGKTSVDVMDVEEVHSGHYLKTARNYVMNAIHYAQMFDASTDPELAASKAVILEERRKVEDAKLVARLVETRESLVSGIISGLMPKINRRLKNAKTSFFIGEDSFELYTALTDERTEIDFVYNRRDFSVLVRVNDLEFREDWTALSGNRPMRDQSEGYKAVVDFLEGEGEELADEG